MKRIIQKLGETKVLYETTKALAKERNALEKEAFDQGNVLYKKIMATPESQKKATVEEINQALELLKKGKHAPEAGGEKGYYRACHHDLFGLLESKEGKVSSPGPKNNPDL